MSKGKRNFLLVLISVMVGIIYFIPYLRFFFYDQMLDGFHLTNLQLGTLGSIYGLVALFCYPVSGYLADRFSARILLTISFLVMAGLTFWQSTFPGYNTLVVIYVLYGFFTTATLWSPYICFVRHLGTEEEQGKLFGVSEAMRGVVSAVTGFVFLWMLGLFVDSVGGMQVLLWISVGLYVLFAVLSIVFLPKTEVKGSKQDGPQEKGMKNIIKALRLPGTWLVAFFLFSCFCVINTGTNYLGTYTTQVLGVSASVSSGLAIFRSYVIVIAAGVMGGILADKAKSRAIFISGLLGGIIVCAALLIFSSSLVTMAIVITMVMSFLYFTVKSVYYSVMGEGGIPLELTAAATGIISFIAYAPEAFMTTIMGSWIDADPVLGFNKIFIWMISFSVISIILAVIIYRRHKKAEGI